MNTFQTDYDAPIPEGRTLESIKRQVNAGYRAFWKRRGMKAPDVSVKLQYGAYARQGEFERGQK